MPELTAITTTKRGRLALFFDGEFDFSLDEDTFAAANLHEGDTLEEYEVEELRRKGDSRRALDKAMDYLSLRDHAAGELYKKLTTKFDAPTAAWAVEKVGELGLLNDESVAKRRAAELYRKQKSRREILRDLTAKGIDKDTAADAVEALYAELANTADEEAEDGDAENPELANARTLVQKKYAAKLAAGKRDNVAAALARHGYPHPIIKAVLSEWDDEE